MSLVRPVFLLSLVLAVLAGCEPSSPPAGTSTTGTMRLAIATPAAVPGDIARVTVTVSGADMSPLSSELVLTDGVWGGVLGDIPAGLHRTFLAQAFNASNALRYEGRAEDVTVTAGATGLVSLLLQDSSAPSPFTNEAPLVDSLVATPTTVAPGGTVSLTASAHDPNAGDSVSYAWAAPSGSFATPSQASTVWTAPTTQGPVKLTLTVSDSRGASLTLNLTLSVSMTTGAQELKVDFNSAPKVVTLTSSQSYLDVGKQTALSVSATDPDGDGLSYQWSATCSGSFTGMDSASATFAPSALPAAACNNCQVKVVVTDGRGGQNTGSLALCISKDTVWTTHGSWNPTGSMSVRRTTHQATLLSNGKVLVSGGRHETSDLATAEVYDPATGTWSPTGSMSTPRALHTATLLSNGKVLVSGGRNEDSYYLATAEVYDPATGTWSPTGSMSTPRSSHTATPLPNGKVLVSGGTTTGHVYLATAEVYDPATGTWSNTGALSAPRYWHEATRLSTGKVLVSGGVKSGAGLVTAEVYDPAMGTWSNTGSMTQARANHELTLLPDGKVLATGGYDGPTELYDPATGTWRSTGAMTEPRDSPGAILLRNGKVLVSGGRYARELLTTEVYDPSKGSWTSAGPMAEARRLHTTTLLPDGKVLVSGGFNYNNSVLMTAEVYDPGP
ncbi:PKD domain-containing protein [Archangium minus]|uniref:PKD domain-containing protein n=1 Tax=Archangium minus TaxID=83450 RepID=A0ABY9WRI6_9BACT|nr:PKD domain-containing protein [Archangium minus]